MKTITLLIFSVFFVNLIPYPEFPVLKAREVNHLTGDAKGKVLSGLLFENIDNLIDKSLDPFKKANPKILKVILYFSEYPSTEQVDELERYCACLYRETWTPPLENHPYGFMLVAVPLTNLQEIFDLPVVKRVDSAGRGRRELNNDAARSIRAPLVWANDLTGKGITIGILDSGLDTTYAGTDLPDTFKVIDYSYFPQIDNDVINPSSGHGTHVTATALGRGVLSEGYNHNNNGKGSFMGIAPDAALVFLKIGQDDDAFAYDSCTIPAIDAAINIYDVDILSMSYGGWDDYHDGTSALEQKVD